MPGVGVRTAAVLLITFGDGTGFPSGGHLASYAGLAPTTRSSGTSIHGEHARRGGSWQLKRAMFLSAFACMNADPASGTLYDRQRAQGKTLTQALLRIARQRISVLFAMLRDGTRHPRSMTTPNTRIPGFTSLTKDIETRPGQSAHVIDWTDTLTPQANVGGRTIDLYAISTVGAGRLLPKAKERAGKQVTGHERTICSSPDTKSIP
jgi:hypothetical protein